MWRGAALSCLRRLARRAAGARNGPDAHPHSMLTPYELFVGLRYTRAKRRNHFISFISITSMLGIALGVTALIVVLSVMNGFQKELRARILGVASHVQIVGLGGALRDWEQ